MGGLTIGILEQGVSNSSGMEGELFLCEISGGGSGGGNDVAWPVEMMGSGAGAG